LEVCSVSVLEEHQLEVPLVELVVLPRLEEADPVEQVPLEEFVVVQLGPVLLVELANKQPELLVKSS
jgi:hypothetical protein